MKKMLATSITFLMISFSISAFAHGPTPQRVDETIEIAASADTVWKKVQDFSTIGAWHPQVVSIEMPDESTRILTLENGEVTESLDYVDAKSKSLGYRLLTENFEAIPVSFYTIGLELEQQGEVTVLSWNGRFYRADTGNFPPENLNDEAAVKAMTDFARAGLEGLKANIEGQ